MSLLLQFFMRLINANGCSEANPTGQTEVNPKPVINKAYRIINKNETCFGSADGSIIFP